MSRGFHTGDPTIEKKKNGKRNEKKEEKKQTELKLNSISFDCNLIVICG